MIVSLEAVPRNPEALLASARAALGFPQIQLINVPDLKRFSLRSWEACGLITEAGLKPRVMPHIRAIDFDMNQPFPHREFFRSRGIDRALVIAGDPPDIGPENGPEKGDTLGAEIYPTETTAFIRKLKAEMPELKVYAAFDPYRSNIRYELDYLTKKEEAGAEAFMSQPFFDLRLLEIYAEYLEGKTVYWGISPVLSASARNYWESRNRAIFPRSFRPDLFWNVDFGRRVLDFCQVRGFNLYLMPIKVDVQTYLQGLFS